MTIWEMKNWKNRVSKIDMKIDTILCVLRGSFVISVFFFLSMIKI